MPPTPIVDGNPRLKNESMVYQSILPEEKLTVAEITARVQQKIAEGSLRPIGERTIRRAINSLCEKNLLVEAGKEGQALLYTIGSKDIFDDSIEERLIPFNGSLLNIKDFLHLMVNEESPALQKGAHALSVKAELIMRKAMVYTILSAGNPGLNQSVRTAREKLTKYHEELAFLTRTTEAFIDSPIWYDQYRDRLAVKLRKLEQESPELYQLARDLITNNESEE